MKSKKFTAKLLDEGQLGTRAPQIYAELGTALSVFLEIASCQWECRGGEHNEENLVRHWQITHLHTDAQNALQPTTLRALLSRQWPASAQLARFRLPPQLPSATF
jgi:hypothetical protein